MKLWSLTLAVLVLAGGAMAQSSSEPSKAPGLEVVDINWRKVERNLKLEEDPLLIADQQADLQRAQKNAIQQNVLLARVNEPLMPVPTQTSNPRPMPPGPVVNYLYEVDVKNTGSKSIKKIVWEYGSYDAIAQRYVGRREYVSNVKIRPGTVKKLVVQSTMPPIAAVNAAQNDANQTSQRVVVQRIYYVDGSVWQRP